MSSDSVVASVDARTTAAWLGLLGEPAVNVLELNLALDAALGPAAN
jgi:K+-transporting ATPase c subunit